MTSEAPATALAAAMAAVAGTPSGLTHQLPQATICFNFIRDNGPALAAALRDAERYRFLRKSTTAPLTSMTADEFDANVDSHMPYISARVDDTPTRGTQ